MILVIGVFLMLSTLLFLYYTLQPKSSRPFPPGPWGFPIIGHLPILGPNPIRKLREWKRIHGNIYFIRFGSYPAIILNDAKLIKEAFNLPAFSGRAQIESFIKGTDGKGIGLSEGVDNKEQRQFLQRTLKRLGVNMEGSIQQEISDLLTYLKAKRGRPVRVNHLFSTYILNSYWNIIMGQRFHHQDKEIAKIINMVNKAGDMDSMLEKMVTFMPWIEKLVEKYSHQRVKLLQHQRDYFSHQIEQRQQTWVKGQPRHFTDAYFDKVDVTHDPNSSFHKKRNFQPQTTSDIFVASMATTVTTLEWLICNLAKNPVVQKNVQNEIDNVIGHSRLPCVSDRGQMPYCEALILENFRYSNTIPLGVFHRTLTDVEFHGYKIPKNIMIISDFASLHHDPGTWSDPENFRPERFIEDGAVRKSEALLPFSTGQRACVGEQTARDQLFLYVTSLCQVFDIKFPPKFESRKIKGIFGIALMPSEFHVHFNERIF